MGNSMNVQGSAENNADKKLENYISEQFSKEKEDLIRQIGKGMRKALGSQFTNSNDIKDITEALAERVSALESKKVNTKNQEAVLNALEESIKSAYPGQNLINESGSVKQRIENVSEIISSLVRSLHNDVFGIITDVKNSIQNLQALIPMLEQSVSRESKVLEANLEPKDQMKIGQIREFTEAVVEEANRQLIMLSQLLDMRLMPIHGDIEKLIETSDLSHSFIRKIKGEFGADETGKALAQVLAGYSRVGLVAGDLSRRLREMGVDLHEYLKTGNKEAFLSKIVEKISANSKLSQDDKLKVIEAVNTLVKNDDSSMMLNVGKIKGGYDVQIRLRGEKKNSIERRLERVERGREVLIREFEKQLKNAYKNIVHCMDAISSDIATGKLEVDDAVKQFAVAFVQMDTIERKSIGLVLSGYAISSSANDRRDQFISSIKAVIDNAKSIEGMSPSAKEMRVAAENLLAVIEKFKENVLSVITLPTYIQPVEAKVPLRAVKGGDGDGNSDNSDNSDDREINLANMQVERQNDAKIYMIDDSEAGDVSGGGDGQMDSRKVYVNMKLAKVRLQHALKIAKISREMIESSKELDEYGADYQQVLGEAAGALASKFETEYAEDMESLQNYDRKQHDNSALRLSELFKMFVKYKNGMQGAENSANLQEARLKLVNEWEEIAKALYELKHKSRNGMLRVAQAVDLYIANFVKAASSHPDEVKQIDKLTSATQWIAQFYNKKSIDNVIDLFETFPGNLAATVEFESSTGIGFGSWSEYVHDLAKTEPSSAHYYRFVEKVMSDGSEHTFLGNPYAAILPKDKKQFNTLIDKLKRVIAGTQALQNIVEAFYAVGGDYTGKSLATAENIPMDPQRMYLEIVGYLVATCLSYEFASGLVKYVQKADAASSEVKGDFSISNAVNKIDYKFDQSESKTNLYQLGAFNNRLESAAALANAHARSPDTVSNDDAKADYLMYPGKNFAAGVSGSNTVTDTVTSTAGDEQIRKKIAFCLASIPEPDEKLPTGVVVSKLKNGFKNHFKETDELLWMVLKSFCAKTMIIVQKFVMFNRPLKQIDMNPTRMILGGAEGGANMLDHINNEYPEIVPGAAGVYLRLPLLMETIIDMFGVHGSNNKVVSPSGLIISYIPDPSSPFNTMYSYIAEKMRSAAELRYSVSEEKQLIKWTTEIIKYFKNSKDLSDVVLREFIKDVNRKYGFMKASSLLDYDNKLRDPIDVVSSPNDLEVDETEPQFDVLDLNSTRPQKPAPSDKYVDFKHYDASIKSVISKDVKDLIVKFRKNLDDRLSYVKNNALMTMYHDNSFNTLDGIGFSLALSFDHLIHDTDKELSKATDKKTRYELVHKMLDSVNYHDTLSVEDLALYKDLVCAPIKLLDFIMDYVKDFRDLCFNTDLNRLKTAIANGGGANVDAQYAAELKKDFPYDYKQISPHQNSFDGAAGANAEEKLFNVYHETIVSSVYEIATNLSDFVTYSVSADGVILLDFTRCMELCQSLIYGVRSALEKYRSIYGLRLTRVDSSSLIQLEERYDVLFRDKNKSDVNRANSSLSQFWKMLRDNSNNRNMQLGSLYQKLVYWEGSEEFTVGNDQQSEYPFNLLPRFDNGFGGIARDEFEKVIEKKISEVRLSSASLEAINERVAVKNFIALLTEANRLTTQDLEEDMKELAFGRVNQLQLTNKSGSFNLMHVNSGSINQLDFSGVNETVDLFEGSVRSPFMQIIKLVDVLNQIIAKESQIVSFKTITDKEALFNAIKSAKNYIAGITDLFTGLAKVVEPQLARKLNYTETYTKSDGNDYYLGDIEFQQYVSDDLEQYHKLMRLLNVSLNTQSVKDSVEGAIAKHLSTLIRDMGDGKGADQFEENVLELSADLNNNSVNRVYDYSDAKHVQKVHDLFKDAIVFYTGADEFNVQFKDFGNPHRYTSIVDQNYLQDLKNIEEQIKLVIEKSSASDVFSIGSVLAYFTGGDAEPTHGLGLIAQLNDVICNLIKCSYDETSGKFYLPLIESIANNMLAPAVMKGVSLRDMTAGGGSIMMGDPVNSVVMFASVSRVIRNLVLLGNNEQYQKLNPRIKIVAVKDVESLPVYLVDSMKANLPILLRELQSIIKKAKFLQSSINGDGKISLNMERPASADPGFLQIEEKNLYIAYENPFDQVDSSTFKTKIKSLLEAVINVGYEFAESTSQLFRKLGDAPIYGELSNNFVSSYKQRNLQLPFCPLSFALYSVTQNAFSNGSTWVSSKSGSDEYKYKYNLRGLLRVGSEVKLSQLPTVKYALDEHNSSSNKLMSFSEGYVEDHVSNIIAAIRILQDYNFNREYIHSANNVQIMNVAPFGYAFSLPEIISKVESNDPHTEFKSYSQHETSNLQAQTYIDQRAISRVYNIMDIGPPINPNAMMRSIPFINLINADYVYDRILVDSIDTTANNVGPTTLTTKVEHLLIKLLQNPFCPVYSREYIDLLPALMRGDNMVIGDFSRPKALTELWNSVLLQNIYHKTSRGDFADGEVDQFGPVAPAIYNRYNTYVSRPANDASRVMESRSDRFRNHPAADNLSYTVKLNGKTQIRTVDLNGYKNNYLFFMSRARFDTKLIRYLFWSVLTQLMLQVIITRRVEADNFPVVEETAGAKPSITRSFLGNEDDFERFI
jgi:hypothetical protein